MKRTILKSIATVALFIVAGTSAFAQYVNDAENDTVATGSQARYLVDLDITANAIYNNSGIVWTFPAGYTAANFTRIDGVTALSTGADLAYDQNEIVMTAGAVASGLVLSAREQSRPLAGIGCLAANATTRTIDIVALPAATYGADSGACALPASLPLPVNFTGYGNYDVQFTVQAYDLTNAAVGAADVINVTGFYNNRVSGTQNGQRVAIATTAFEPLPVAGGYYVVTMTNLQDRISRKTLGYAFNTINVANANADGADEYRYFVYPTPTTQPVQHIRNY